MAEPDESTITEITRREVVELITTKVKWSGRLDEVEFLARLYDLSALPSTDWRCSDASADIHLHRVEFHDGGDDWVFYDQRFNLLRAPDGEFLRFLCETLHPAVRPDTHDAETLAAAFNYDLQHDGWELYPAKQMSGRPIYSARRLDQRAVVFDEPTGWDKVDQQLGEARRHLKAADSEATFQAVGVICREVLISLAQEVFDATKHPTLDGAEAGTADSGRMLQAYVSAELAGSANEESRAFAKSAVKLALALHHKRTADFRMAALALEAATAVVNLVSLLAGRRSNP